VKILRNLLQLQRQALPLKRFHHWSQELMLEANSVYLRIHLNEARGVLGCGRAATGTVPLTVDEDGDPCCVVCAEVPGPSLTVARDATWHRAMVLAAAAAPGGCDP
jgi:hypothetical protein